MSGDDYRGCGSHDEYVFGDYEYVLVWAQVEETVIADSQFIYIEGYLIAADDGFEAAQVAQKVAQAHGTKVALTLSDPSIVAAFKDRMTALVDAGVDMLFCK